MVYNERMEDWIDELYQGDAFIKPYEFPKASFKLLIFDLPYNIGENTKLTKQGNKIVSNKDAWNNEFKDNRTEREMFSFIRKVVKVSKYSLMEGGSIFIFFDRSKPYYLYPFYLFFEFRNKLIFEKLNPLPHFRKNNYRSSYEECWWFSKGKSLVNFLGQSKMKNVFKGNIGVKETKHPTEKYEWMIKPIILRHSNEGDLVGDFFMGSGTTCVVAKKLRRKYVGIELNEEFYNMAKERIENVNSLYSLNKDIKEWL